MAMKITIEQLDIEQAIKDHIGSMMEIKEGAQLDIDLSATRGSAGFTATITISNAGEAARVPAAEPVTETTQASASKPAKAAKALNIPKNEKPAAEPVEEAAQTADAETAVVDHEPAAPTEDNTSEDIADSDAEDTPAGHEEPEAPAEAAPRASLFGGLTKPKN